MAKVIVEREKVGSTGNRKRRRRQMVA